MIGARLESECESLQREFQETTAKLVEVRQKTKLVEEKCTAEIATLDARLGELPEWSRDDLLMERDTVIRESNRQAALLSQEMQMLTSRLAVVQGDLEATVEQLNKQRERVTGKGLAAITLQWRVRAARVRSKYCIGLEKHYHAIRVDNVKRLQSALRCVLERLRYSRIRRQEIRGGACRLLQSRVRMAAKSAEYRAEVQKHRKQIRKQRETQRTSEIAEMRNAHANPGGVSATNGPSVNSKGQTSAPSGGNFLSLVPTLSQDRAVESPSLKLTPDHTPTQGHGQESPNNLNDDPGHRNGADSEPETALHSESEVGPMGSKFFSPSKIEEEMQRWDQQLQDCNESTSHVHAPPGQGKSAVGDDGGRATSSPEAKNFASLLPDPTKLPSMQLPSLDGSVNVTPLRQSFNSIGSVTGRAGDTSIHTATPSLAGSMGGSPLPDSVAGTSLSFGSPAFAPLPKVGQSPAQLAQERLEQQAAAAAASSSAASPEKVNGASDGHGGNAMQAAATITASNQDELMRKVAVLRANAGKRGVNVMVTSKGTSPDGQAFCVLQMVMRSEKLDEAFLCRLQSMLRRCLSVAYYHRLKTLERERGDIHKALLKGDVLSSKPLEDSQNANFVTPAAVSESSPTSAANANAAAFVSDSVDMSVSQAGSDSEGTARETETESIDDTSTTDQTHYSENPRSSQQQPQVTQSYVDRPSSNSDERVGGEATLTAANVKQLNEKIHVLQGNAKRRGIEVVIVKRGNRMDGSAFCVVQMIVKAKAAEPMIPAKAEPVRVISGDSDSKQEQEQTTQRRYCEDHLQHTDSDLQHDPLVLEQPQLADSQEQVQEQVQEQEQDRDSFHDDVDDRVTAHKLEGPTGAVHDVETPLTTHHDVQSTPLVVAPIAPVAPKAPIDTSVPHTASAAVAASVNMTRSAPPVEKPQKKSFFRKFFSKKSENVPTVTTTTVTVPTFKEDPASLGQSTLKPNIQEPRQSRPQAQDDIAFPTQGQLPGQTAVKPMPSPFDEAVAVIDDSEANNANNGPSAAATAAQHALARALGIQTVADSNGDGDHHGDANGSVGPASGQGRLQRGASFQTPVWARDAPSFKLSESRDGGDSTGRAPGTSTTASTTVTTASKASTLIHRDGVGSTVTSTATTNAIARHRDEKFSPVPPAPAELADDDRLSAGYGFGDDDIASVSSSTSYDPNVDQSVSELHSQLADPDETPPPSRGFPHGLDVTSMLTYELEPLARRPLQPTQPAPPIVTFGSRKRKPTFLRDTHVDRHGSHGPSPPTSTKPVRPVHKAGPAPFEFDAQPPPQRGPIFSSETSGQGLQSGGDSQLGFQDWQVAASGPLRPLQPLQPNRDGHGRDYDAENKVRARVEATERLRMEAVAARAMEHAEEMAQRRRLEQNWKSPSHNVNPGKNPILESPVMHTQAGHEEEERFRRARASWMTDDDPSHDDDGPTTRIASGGGGGGAVGRGGLGVGVVDDADIVNLNATAPLPMPTNMHMNVNLKRDVAGSNGNISDGVDVIDERGQSDGRRGNRSAASGVPPRRPVVRDGWANTGRQLQPESISDESAGARVSVPATGLLHRALLPSSSQTSNSNGPATGSNGMNQIPGLGENETLQPHPPVPPGALGQGPGAMVADAAMAAALKRRQKRHSERARGSPHNAIPPMQQLDPLNLGVPALPLGSNVQGPSSQLEGNVTVSELGGSHGGRGLIKRTMTALTSRSSATAMTTGSAITTGSAPAVMVLNRGQSSSRFDRGHHYSSRGERDTGAATIIQGGLPASVAAFLTPSPGSRNVTELPSISKSALTASGSAAGTGAHNGSMSARCSTNTTHTVSSAHGRSSTTGGPGALTSRRPSISDQVSLQDALQTLSRDATVSFNFVEPP